MKLNVVSLGIALGVVLGLTFFLTTIMIVLQSGGAHLHLLRRVCPGYSVSVAGSFLALVYWFIYGFVGGALLAFIYNRVSSR